MWVNCSEVDELRACYRLKSEREKQILYTNAYIWNLKKNSWWTYLQRRNGDTDIENWLVDTAGEGEVRTNWESSIDIHTLSCVIQITIGKLLHGTGRPARPSVTSRGWNGEEEAREGGGIYTIMTNSHWCTAETTTILQTNYPPIKKRERETMRTVVPLYRWEK